MLKLRQIRMSIPKVWLASNRLAVLALCTAVVVAHRFQQVVEGQVGQISLLGTPHCIVIFFLRAVVIFALLEQPPEVVMRLRVILITANESTRDTGALRHRRPH
jgi:hypothetical protein